MTMKQIAAKLNKIMADVGYIQKDGTNKFQNYTYLSEAGLLDKLRPALIKHGVVAIPSVVNYDTQPAGTTAKGAQQFLTTVLIETQFIDCESGESLSVRHVGQGMDNGDKGSYKATTGANKYTMFKTFQIPTGDDAEQESPEVAKPRTPASATPATGKPKLIQKINKALEALADQNVSGFGSVNVKLEHLYEHTGMQDTKLLFKLKNDKLQAYLNELRRLYKEHQAA